MSPETFDEVLSNICGLATFVLAVPLPAALSTTAPPASRACICAYIAANCSCYCLMIAFKLY